MFFSTILAFTPRVRLRLDPIGTSDGPLFSSIYSFLSSCNLHLSFPPLLVGSLHPKQQVMVGFPPPTLRLSVGMLLRSIGAPSFYSLEGGYLKGKQPLAFESVQRIRKISSPARKVFRVGVDARSITDLTAQQYGSKATHLSSDVDIRSSLYYTLAWGVLEYFYGK